MKEAGITMAALLSLAATTARSAPRQGLVAACKAEVAELCPSVEPGEGRIAQCLSDNQQKLTKGCQAALRHARRAKATAHKASGASTGQAASGDLAEVVNLATSLVDLAATDGQKKTEAAPIPKSLPDSTPAAEAQPASPTP